MTREKLFIELARRAAEHAVALGQLHFRIDECGDGSGRYLAAIGWDEQEYLYTPAPDGAPPWATARYDDWSRKVMA